MDRNCKNLGFTMILTGSGQLRNESLKVANILSPRLVVMSVFQLSHSIISATIFPTKSLIFVGPMSVVFPLTLKGVHSVQAGRFKRRDLKEAISSDDKTVVKDEGDFAPIPIHWLRLACTLSSCPSRTLQRLTAAPLLCTID